MLQCWVHAALGDMVDGEEVERLFRPRAVASCIAMTSLLSYKQAVRVGFLSLVPSHCCRPHLSTCTLLDYRVGSGYEPGQALRSTTAPCSDAAR